MGYNFWSYTAHKYIYIPQRYLLSYYAGAVNCSWQFISEDMQCVRESNAKMEPQKDTRELKYCSRTGIAALPAGYQHQL